MRERKKGHGTKKEIEGGFRSGYRVVILDDVVTKGGSVLKAVDAAREAGAEVVLVLAVVDREEGGGDLVKSQGFTFDSLFTKQDLIDLEQSASHA